jgi:hypothetical protein
MVGRTEPIQGNRLGVPGERRRTGIDEHGDAFLNKKDPRTEHHQSSLHVAPQSPTGVLAFTTDVFS